MTLLSYTAMVLLYSHRSQWLRRLDTRSEGCGGDAKWIIRGLSLISPISPASGQDIDVKGLRLGMAKAEVLEKFGSLPIKFTIAGVSGKYSSFLSPKFHEDKLDSLAFFFESKHFETILDAAKSKYPALQCETSTVKNAMGASFQQVRCQLRDQTGILTVSRFVSDLTTSVLSLQSDRSIREFAEKQLEKQKDF